MLSEYSTDGSVKNSYSCGNERIANVRFTYYGCNAESYNTNTGLQYLRARYYAPSNGNFMTEDGMLGTQTDPLTRNRYLYVVNNPLNYHDPSGKFFKKLWNGVKRAAKAIIGAVNKYVVQLVKRFVKYARYV